MSDFTPANPTPVNESAVPAQLMALVRDGLLAATAWAIGKGYIDQATGTQLVMFGAGLATIAWRQFVTHSAHKKLVAAASEAPSFEVR